MFIGKHKFYAAADPGAKGAIALMNAAGHGLKVWKMPMTDGEIDLLGLYEIFLYLKRLPDVGFGIEWATAWPGAFSNVIRDAEVFGRQKGILQAFTYLSHLPQYHITPQGWKGKLALDGKSREGSNEAAAAALLGNYPEARSLIYGPRGGLLDGPMDALLIAHYMRLVSGACSANAVRGSVEHFAAVMSAGPGRRKLARMPLKEFI